MKVLVTGASGFVGSHAVAALLAGGDEVRCLVRDPGKLERVLGPGVCGVRGACEARRGDLSSPAELERACEGVESVLHVAGLVAAHRRRELFEVNRDGTQRLLEARRAAAPGARFVYVGSLAAAGPSPRGKPHEGHEPPRPVTPYGASKLAGEERVRASGLDWVVVRPPAVYGPRDREFLRLFRAARAGLVPLFGDGSQELSLVYVEDLADALTAALHRGRPGSVYYAAHPEVTTARLLVQRIASALGRTRAPRIVGLPRPLVWPILAASGAAAFVAGRATLLAPGKAREFLAPAWTCSPAFLARDTGWSASTGLSAGLAKTVEWYRGNGQL